MTTTEAPARYRSYDYMAGDTFYLEGERVGYATCFTAYADGPYGREPYHAYTEPVADLHDVEDLGRACVHLVLLVDAVSEAWRAMGISDQIGTLVYPPLAEEGKVVPL